MTMPSLDYELVREDGERGWIGAWHSHVNDDSMEPMDEVLKHQFIDETRLFIATSTPPNITRRWTLRLRGQLKPRSYDVAFEFGLSVAGRAKVRFRLPWPSSFL